MHYIKTSIRKIYFQGNWKFDRIISFAEKIKIHFLKLYSLLKKLDSSMSRQALSNDVCFSLEPNPSMAF